MAKKIFKILSILFILACIGFYGYRFYYYYNIYHKNSNWNEVEHIALYKTVLKNSYINNDLSQLDDGYIYNYKNDNNYVKYSGSLWRIERIYEDGKIRLIGLNSGPVLSNSAVFKESFISKYLNNENSVIYRNLEDPDIYLSKTSVCLDNIDDIENITCNETEEYLFGIPSISDYQLTGGLEGFIKSDREFWLSNMSEESQYYISDTGEVKKTKVLHHYEILPIITLSGEVEYSYGDGSLENPYAVGNPGTSYLNQKGINEYISFNEKVWKIIDQDEIGTKVVLDGVLENKRIFDKKYNKFESSDIYKYLNGDYYKSFSDELKEKIIKGKWYTGVYTSSNEYDYNSIYESSIEAYVGLLNINDLGLLEYENVYTLTPSDSKNSVIFTVASDNTVYADSVSRNKNIRPVLYLDSNSKIVSGKGSKEEPYVVE